MTQAQTLLRKRLAVMAIVNVAAVIAAGAFLVGYLKFGQGWALPGFIAAMLVGFAAQIWFIAGLRGPNSLSEDATRGTRGGGRA